jgi:hypothetical protein
MPLVFLAAATTTTTVEEVPRVVGDPLPLWIFWASGIALLVVILAAGWYVGRRTKASR